MSLPPKALHCLTALRAELLARPAEVQNRQPEAAPELDRRADVESRQQMRHAKRSKASIASRHYQRQPNWLTRG